MPSFANAVIKSTQSKYLKKAPKGNPGIKSAAEIQRIVDNQLAGLPALPKTVAVSSMMSPVVASAPNFA